jgi:hypothetical protein
MATMLPLETQTLYAELLEHLIGVRGQRSIGELTGSFAEKTIKNERYLYWQASQPGGKTKQFYLGRRTAALDQMVRRLERQHALIAPDLERVDRLAAQLRAGGANTADQASARVVRALGESGLFDAGAVLVGTHAFAVLGNVLGVRWSSGSLRTQDVDLAGSRDADIDVAVPDADADVPSILEGLQMGFLPVPPLDPKHPSTSFKVRGQAVRVDLLCPKRGASDDPVFIRRFNAAAQPLAYLDYLLQMPERALLIDGGATLVNVPSPARFAFHKLLVASLRPAAFQTKAEKDIIQAAQVLEALVDSRPGDLAPAWEALSAHSSRRAQAGLTQLARRVPEVHGRVRRLLGSSGSPRRGRGRSTPRGE